MMSNSSSQSTLSTNDSSNGSSLIRISENPDASNLSTDDTNNDYIYNIKQTFIQISEDRVKLILKDYLEQIKKQESWLVALGIFISLLVVVLITEKFKNFLSVSADVWQTIIYLSLFISGLWWIYSGIKALCSKKYSIDTIVKEMKNQD